MTFYVNEIVRVRNSTARVRYYDANSSTLILMDIRGEIKSGDTVTGDESGVRFTFNTFNVSDEIDLQDYENYLIENDNILICLDSGAYVATDAHFNGLPSQDYQRTYFITL